ncbi:hypothetical protein QQ045_016190 [Rhodiola kirilowii]
MPSCHLLYCCCGSGSDVSDFGLEFTAVAVVVAAVVVRFWCLVGGWDVDGGVVGLLVVKEKQGEGRRSFQRQGSFGQGWGHEPFFFFSSPSQSESSVRRRPPASRFCWAGWEFGEGEGRFWLLILALRGVVFGLVWLDLVAVGCRRGGCGLGRRRVVAGFGNRWWSVCSSVAVWAALRGCRSKAMDGGWWFSAAERLGCGFGRACWSAAVWLLLGSVFLLEV